MQLREEDIQQIEGMGFTRMMAVAALQRHPNITLAVNYLLEVRAVNPVPVRHALSRAQG